MIGGPYTKEGEPILLYPAWFRHLRSTEDQSHYGMLGSDIIDQRSFLWHAPLTELLTHITSLEEGKN